MTKVIHRGTLCLAGLLAFGFANATSYHLHRRDVIPVRFDSTLSTNSSRVGDRFQASVADGSVLPIGSYFEGVVTKVQKKSGNHAPVLDLKFTRVYFPDGSNEPVSAAPVPLSRKYVDKSKSGRYTAKPTITNADAIGAGALGGLLLGSVLHKPFEGTFLGTLAGIIYSSTNHSGQNVVLKKGSEEGAFIRQNVVLTDSGSANNQISSVQNNTNSNQSMGQVGQSNPVDQSGPPNAPADPMSPQAMNISIGSTHLTFPNNELPYRWGNAVMVPLRSTAKQLNLSVDKSGNYIFVDSNQHSLRLQLNSNLYILDGNSGSMAEPVTLKGAVAFVPADILAKADGQNLQVSAINFQNSVALSMLGKRIIN